MQSSEKFLSAHLQNEALALYRAKEANKCLQFELDDLKQKLHDAEGDVKVRRLGSDFFSPIFSLARTAALLSLEAFNYSLKGQWKMN